MCKVAVRAPFSRPYFYFTPVPFFILCLQHLLFFYTLFAALAPFYTLPAAPALFYTLFAALALFYTLFAALAPFYTLFAALALFTLCLQFTNCPRYVKIVTAWLNAY